MENLPKHSFEREYKRIVILSDTHDSLAVPEKVEQMKSLDGDINVHIGDVFDSKIRAEILGIFKVNQDLAIEQLTEREKEIFDHLVADGNVPIRAYWMARVRANPELLQNIKVELDQAYEIFVSTFRELPKAKWLYGNVEQSYVQSTDFQKTKVVKDKQENIEAVSLPKTFYEDEKNLGVLFPSLPKKENITEQVNNFLHELEIKIKENSNLRNVIIIAHEYLYHGLPPEKFKEKMAEARIEEYYVPFYLPNNYRKEILDFIFKIPEGVNVKFIYGHLHDSKEITQAGIAFKHADDKVGMRWGVNKKDKQTGERKTRYFDMYQLPFQSIHTIDIRGADIKIEEQK